MSVLRSHAPAHTAVITRKVHIAVLVLLVTYYSPTASHVLVHVTTLTF